MTYNFSISNLILTCTNTRRTIVANSVDLHIAKFSFDSIWTGVGKTATFTNSKTGVSVNKVIDLDQCIIPWETLQSTKDGGNLIVCVTGVDGTTIFPTKMDDNFPLIIEMSSPTNGLPPQDPTPSVYDQIMTEFANRYVDSIFEHKVIPQSEWETVMDIFMITPNFEPTIVNGTTLNMRTANLTDYLDRVSYPYTDFYLDYSTNGITTTRIVASSEGGNSPSLRRINFNIGGNSYEVRITATQITIRRASGTTAYYIHELLLRFDDFYRYNYVVDGLTPYYKSSIFVEDNSKTLIRGISFNQFPDISDGYIQLNFSQIPQGDISTKFFGFKTDENVGCAEWCNIYGNSVFANISDTPIDDLDDMQNNRLATIGQIKEYIASKLI